MNTRSIFALLAASLCCIAVAASTASASGSGGKPELASGPASGFVPARDAHAAGPAAGGKVFPLKWGGGPVMHSTTVVPVYWGTKWSDSSFAAKISGLDTFYTGVGGTAYAKTNSEYTDGSGNVDTTHISKSSNLTDLSATPAGAPSTSAVLNEVAKMTNGDPVVNAYYPVYSDQPRGNAGYCAWHSTGTINGKRVQFGFFFNLDGDAGCDPKDAGTIHSQGLEALANVSGHELSEMLTDPQLNAWYDQKGAENSDKCAWTFSGLVSIGGQSWKIQGNWSNAAAASNSGYANVGCIQTS